MKKKFKTEKGITAELTLDIWNAIIFVFLGTEFQDIQRFADFMDSGIKIPDMDDTCKGYVTKQNFQKNQPQVLIWLPENATEEEIAHECFHAAALILESRGVLYDSENQEPFAYTLGFLVKYIHKLEKNDRKQKNQN